MPPTIETPRLTLRTFSEADFEPYFERLLSQRAVMRFLSGTGEPRTREEADHAVKVHMVHGVATSLLEQSK